MASLSRPCFPRSATVRAPALAVFAALAVVLGPGPAHAQWSLDATVERFDWHEDVPPLDVQETGPRIGAGAAYLMRRDRGALAGFRASVYGGAVDYQGSLLSSSTTAASGTTSYLGWTASAEGRWRWPGTVDGVAALDVNFWTRQLSTTQEEEFRVLSMRLGLDRPAWRSSRITVGGGVRWLLAIQEQTTIQLPSNVLRVQLSPDPGWNPYLQAGYRFKPRWLALAYWDGMRMGASDPLVVNTGSGSQTVFQPATDVNVIGLRLTFEP